MEERDSGRTYVGRPVPPVNPQLSVMLVKRGLTATRFGDNTVKLEGSDGPTIIRFSLSAEEIEELFIFVGGQPA